MKEEEKLTKSDYVIYNDTTIKELEEKVKKVLNELLLQL